MRPAVTSPTPGRVSSCSTVAVLRSSGADGVPRRSTGVRWEGRRRIAGAGDEDLLAVGELAGEVDASRSAPEVAPPAARMASCTRLPAGSRTRPGRRTWPATWTATWPVGFDEPPEVSGTARGRIWPEPAAPEPVAARTGGARASGGGVGQGGGHSLPVT